MGQPANEDQASLGTFDAANTTAESNETNTNNGSEPNSPTEPRATSRSCPEPLEQLYDTLETYADQQLPQAAFSLPATRAICPQSKHCTTRDIPDGIPALPFHVGQWELAVHNESRVVYSTSGDAYDSRWGDGGALYGMEVYLNDRGANRDDKYHRRAQTVVGYENGDQVRTTDINSRDDFRSPCGHNVGENDGDRAFSSGTKTRAEAPREAILELLLHLHTNPGPMGRYIDQNPDTAWELERLSPRLGKWTANAPAGIDDDKLSLLVRGSTIKLTSNNEGGSCRNQTHYTFSDLSAVPDVLFSRGEKIQEFATVAAAIAATNELLSTEPRDALLP